MKETFKNESLQLFNGNHRIDDMKYFILMGNNHFDCLRGDKLLKCNINLKWFVTYIWSLMCEIRSVEI